MLNIEEGFALFKSIMTNEIWEGICEHDTNLARTSFVMEYGKAVFDSVLSWEGGSSCSEIKQWTTKNFQGHWYLPGYHTDDLDEVNFEELLFRSFRVIKQIIMPVVDIEKPLPVFETRTVEKTTSYTLYKCPNCQKETEDRGPKYKGRFKCSSCQLVGTIKEGQ